MSKESRALKHAEQARLSSVPLSTPGAMPPGYTAPIAAPPPAGQIPEGQMPQVSATDRAAKHLEQARLSSVPLSAAPGTLPPGYVPPVQPIAAPPPVDMSKELRAAKHLEQAQLSSVPNSAPVGTLPPGIMADGRPIGTPPPAAPAAPAQVAPNAAIPPPQPSAQNPMQQWQRQMQPFSLAQFGGQVAPIAAPAAAPAQPLAPDTGWQDKLSAALLGQQGQLNQLTASSFGNQANRQTGMRKWGSSFSPKNPFAGQQGVSLGSSSKGGWFK